MLYFGTCKVCIMMAEARLLADAYFEAPSIGSDEIVRCILVRLRLPTNR